MVQLWVPGRTFDLGDWEAGSLGAIIGVLLARVSDRTIRKNEQADGLQTRTLEPKDVDMTLCTGDWVEVRSKEEILATLDKNGRLEGLPLMPQMLEQCGKRFQVHKRAHKTCDTVSGHYANRRVPNGIHLGHRCDGKAYGGCQAECLIFWKEAWLKPVGGKPGGRPSEVPPSADSSQETCTIDDVMAATHVQDAKGGQPRYSCQATELLNYSLPLKNWDARQYVEDYRSKNASLRQLSFVLLFAAFQKIDPTGAVGSSRAMALRPLSAAAGRCAISEATGLLAAGPAEPRHPARSSAGRIGASEVVRSNLGDSQCSEHAPRHVLRRRNGPLLWPHLSRPRARRKVRRRAHRPHENAEHPGGDFARGHLRRPLQQ